MYPYEKYNAEFGVVVYNHDGTDENELAINIDKAINHEPHFHTYTRMWELDKNYDIDLGAIVREIISNWMYEDKYAHIELIAKYYNQISRERYF